MSKADEIKDLGIEDDEIENTLKFIGIANDVCKEKGKIKYLDNTEEIKNTIQLLRDRKN